MEKTTKAIHTPYQRRDAYDALQMPVYNCMAFEFDNAEVMADAFCGRTDAPDYSRVLNPTVTHFEQRVANISGAKEVSAFTSGMAAISAMIMSVAFSRRILSLRVIFLATHISALPALWRRFWVETRLVDLTD